MNILSENSAYDGMQGVFSHESEACGGEMTFAVFIPPQAVEHSCPVLWYLSGLTCNHSNVMEKGEYRRLAAELGLIIVCPDTSPRDKDAPDKITDWQLGKGAGFYVDATESPWSENYQMYSYITEELPALIGKSFRADMDRQGIFGHSMGGHGAMTIALKNPDRFKSCSAFAPIVSPSSSPWAQGAMEAYLGPDKSVWRKHDACALVEDGARFPEFLIDQGKADSFLEEGLKPWLFEESIKGTDIALTLRMHERYDHSYYFISTFMNDHLRWHAERL